MIVGNVVMTTITASDVSGNSDGGQDITLTFNDGSTDIGTLMVVSTQTLSVLAEVDTTSNTQGLTATVDSRMTVAAMDAFLSGVIEVSVDSDDESTEQDRRIEVVFLDAGNDGASGRAGPAETSEMRMIELSADPGPRLSGVSDPRLTEGNLLSGQASLLDDITVTDSNEDADLGDRELDSVTGTHGPAIGTIEIIVTAGANGAGNFITGAEFIPTVIETPDGYSAVPSNNGSNVTLTVTPTLTVSPLAAASTEEVTALLTGLRFGAPNSLDPPDTINIEVILTPVAVEGINQTVVRQTYSRSVTDTNRAPTLVRNTAVVATQEDAIVSQVLVANVATGDPLESGQTLTVDVVTSVVSDAFVNNIASVGELFSANPAFGISANGRNVDFTHGTLAANRYGTIEYTLRVRDGGSTAFSPAGDISPPVTMTLRVNPVADDIATIPLLRASTITTTEGESFTSTPIFSAVNDGVDGTFESDDIVVRLGDTFLVNRYGDSTNVGDASDAFSSRVTLLASRISSGDPLSISGNQIHEDFSGQIIFTVDLEDVLGADGVSNSASRLVPWDVEPVNDPLEFNVPASLSINPGEFETNFITDVADPDVDELVVGSVTFRGNSGPYFQSGDTVSVAVLAPDDATPEEKSAVAAENRVSLAGTLPGGVAMETTSNEVVGSANLTVTFSAPKSKAEAEAILNSITISVVSTATYFATRTVEVITLSSANDGAGGNEGGARARTREIFDLLGDMTSPTAPSPAALSLASLSIVPGETEATLTWVALQDRKTPTGEESPNDLEYTITVGEQDPFTIRMNTDITKGYVINGSNAIFRMTRDIGMTRLVLDPGMTYEVSLSGKDFVDLPAEGIAYESKMLELTDELPDTNPENDIHDELDAAVDAAGGIGEYCGGDSNSDFADSDNDMVPNNIEVRLGSDCRNADSRRIGSDPLPTITVNDAMIAAGAQVVLDGSYIVVPGTGERTRIDLVAATCTGCAEDSVRAYVNTTGCETNPGQARPGGDESVCPTSLGSFSNGRILWVGRDGLGNWIRTESSTPTYVAPPVGFDVGVVNLPRTRMSADEVSISIAVSPGAGNFEIDQGDLTVSGGTLSQFTLNQNSPAQLLVTVSGITVPSEVELTAIDGVTFTSESLSSSVVAAVTLDNNNLFSIGNEIILVNESPLETTPTLVADTSFRQTFSAAERGRSQTTSDDISVPESTTARSGVYIDVGRGVLVDTDSIPLSTTVTTDVGINIFTENGVFDYAIDLSESGDIATVLLRLSTVVKTPSEVYKFDGVMELWGPFIATTDEGSNTRHDRVYSAPAIGGQCPGLSGSRQPDPTPGLDTDADPGVGGEHGYAWNLAVLESNNVRVGDKCLLVQIQDGSMNDADGVVDGIVFDPIGLVETEPSTETPRRFTFVCSNPTPDDACSSVRFSPPGGTATAAEPFRQTVRVTGPPDAMITITTTNPLLVVTTPRGGIITIPIRGYVDEIVEVQVEMRRGGGGSMDPIWLILLALAMTLPYGLRRRQSSPFISNL